MEVRLQLIKRKQTTIKERFEREMIDHHNSGRIRLQNITKQFNNFNLGKLNLGILGGFSGTVGTVIGSYNKKGDDIIRAKTKRPRTTFSEGQVNQQSKFSLVTGFMQPLNFLLKTSFKAAANNQMTPFNYACSYALSNAVIGEAPNYELDFSKVQISQGLLSRETTAGAELVDGNVNFHWEDNSGNGSCTAIDKATLLVYNVDKNEVSYSAGVVSRATKTGVIPIPYNEVGDRLLFYMYFQSANDPLLVSQSQFLGSTEIAE